MEVNKSHGVQRSGLVVRRVAHTRRCDLYSARLPSSDVSFVVEIICTLMLRAYFQASARALVSLRSPTEAGCLDR